MVMINTVPETMEVKHPKLKGVVASVFVLDPIETMDIFSGLAKYQKVVVLTDPRTGEILYNPSTEEPFTATVNNIPSSAALEILEKIVDNVKGLEDQNKKPIIIDRNIEGSFKQNLKYLFRKELNCDITRKKKDVQGVEKEVKGSQSFADYIQAELNKKAQGEESSPN